MAIRRLVGLPLPSALLAALVVLSTLLLAAGQEPLAVRAQGRVAGLTPGR